MKFLLDTCIISELIKPQSNEKVIQWIQQVNESNLYISVLTLGEIEKGITKLPDSTRKSNLKQWIEIDLINRFEGKILDINHIVSRYWGKLQGELEIQGNPIPIIDGLIASTALVHNLTLVTRNTKDFEKSNVPIVNPWL